MRVLGRLAAALAIAAVAYVAVTAVQVAIASQRDEREPTEAIVVLGAAQYDGQPSPVFQARLDHALALWREGVAPVVSVTGGGQPGDRSTEASAAAGYLIGNGVPPEAILREVDARNTYESLAATARFLRADGIEQVVLVSDPTHALRVSSIAEEVGLEAQVSSTRLSPASTTTTLRQGARETIAVALGRILGHRRLTNLERLIAAEAEPAVSLS